MEDDVEHRQLTLAFAFFCWEYRLPEKIRKIARKGFRGLHIASADRGLCDERGTVLTASLTLQGFLGTSRSLGAARGREPNKLLEIFGITLGMKAIWVCSCWVAPLGSFCGT